MTAVAKDQFSLKGESVPGREFLLPSQELPRVSVIAKCCFVFSTAFSSLQQLSGKNTSKTKGITLMWISVILKNTRSSPLVCRCHFKGNENLLKKSSDPESNLMWTKTILPTRLCFQGAFSMSWEKLEWEEETGGRKNRGLRTSWISFFRHSSLKEPES